MAWIELHQSVWTHRKTLMLGHALGLPPAYAAAHMMQLWCWALDNAQDGDLTGLPAAVVAAGAGWTGDPDQFVEAAVSAGYLDREGEFLLIHDWHDYAGKLIEARQRDAERKRRARITATSPQPVRRTSAGHQTDIQRNRTVPNPTVPVSSIHPADDGARARETEPAAEIRPTAGNGDDPAERWAVATAMATRFEPVAVLDRLRLCRALRIEDGALVVAPPDDAAVKDDLRRLRPKLQAALRIDKRAALDLIILEPEYEARAGPADDQLFQRSDTG